MLNTSKTSLSIAIAIFLSLSVVGLIGCTQITTQDVTDDTNSRVLKLILEHEAMDKYWHPNTRQRVPVVVKANGLISPDFKHNKFGQPVVLTETPGNRPYLELLSFHRDRTTVEFSARYAVEGVVIHGKAVRTENGWRVVEFNNPET